MTDNSIYEKGVQIGQRIRDERKKAGLTGTQLAVKMSVEQSTISAWENGKTIPPVEKLFALAQVFRCDVGYLLGDYSEPIHDAQTICDSIGLSYDTVRFLHTMHSVLGSDMFARAVDFLITDAQYKSGGSDYNPLLKAISVFLKLDASDNKQVYVMNASGDIKPFDSQGGRRGIRSNEIAFDGDMSDAVALAAINQKLHTLKAAQKRKAARKRNKGK